MGARPLQPSAHHVDIALRHRDHTLPRRRFVLHHLPRFAQVAAGVNLARQITHFGGQHALFVAGDAQHFVDAILVQLFLHELVELDLRRLPRRGTGGARQQIAFQPAFEIINGSQRGAGGRDEFGLHILAVRNCARHGITQQQAGVIGLIEGVFGPRPRRVLQILLGAGQCGRQAPQFGRGLPHRPVWQRPWAQEQLAGLAQREHRCGAHLVQPQRLHLEQARADMRD